MLKLVQRLQADEGGATAIEYGLIASFVFLAITTAVGQVGTQLNSAFTAVNAGFH
jgi:pilus assembly protein Flp/PilA